jgi:hypothetical protein
MVKVAIARRVMRCLYHRVGREAIIAVKVHVEQLGLSAGDGSLNSIQQLREAAHDSHKSIADPQTVYLNMGTHRPVSEIVNA